MQWLIDIIKEWVQDQGYLTTGFVDRGDPAGFDFNVGNFTRDGAWHNLDLSGIVPTGAKGVLISCGVATTLLGKLIMFRKDGNANTINITMYSPQVVGVGHVADGVVPISTDRKLEYLVSSINVYTINFVVKGWWL